MWKIWDKESVRHDQDTKLYIPSTIKTQINHVGFWQIWPSGQLALSILAYVFGSKLANNLKL